jgi:hypothetical protein
MRSSFRNASKIIFRVSRVKTINKFVARSFDIFHRTPFRTILVPKRDSRATFARCVWGVYCDVAAALRQERIQSALSELTAQRRDRACSLDLEAVIRKREVKNEGHCAHAYGAPARL